jgi:hypothetical protein
MKMKNVYSFLFSFLILFFFVTGASSQETIGRSPSEEPEVTLGPTGMPGLGGLHGSDGAVVVVDPPKIPDEGEEEIVLGDTGEPGLGGLSGAKAFRLIPPPDENISSSSEPLGDTGKPGLGGSSGGKI